MGHTLDPTLIPIWIRFIPTHVGHTIPSGIGIPPHPVHPHIRGAYQHPPPAATWQFGSSPHTWGILSSTGGLSSAPRFIPTYVGHTSPGVPKIHVTPVHPHIRGAYRCGRCPKTNSIGSSPHTWGIQAWPSEYSQLNRFIPTYVGHTQPGSQRGERMCGSSPHTWGIQKAPLCWRTAERFIPTYVGHTAAEVAKYSVKSVHPHIRGAYTGPP